MARAIWKGSIAFGLVNIPVGLSTAKGRPDIQLHMVDSKNHARIRHERVNADSRQEVPQDAAATDISITSQTSPTRCLSRHS